MIQSSSSSDNGQSAYGGYNYANMAREKAFGKTVHS